MILSFHHVAMRSDDFSYSPSVRVLWSLHPESSRRPELPAWGRCFRPMQVIGLSAVHRHTISKNTSQVCNVSTQSGHTARAIWEPRGMAGVLVQQKMLTRWPGLFFYKWQWISRRIHALEMLTREDKARGLIGETL